MKIADIINEAAESIVITISSYEPMDLTQEWQDEVDATLQSKGFEADRDYRWYMGYGDDVPNALEIHNTAIIADPALKELVYRLEGESIYDPQGSDSDEDDDQGEPQ